MNNFKGNLRNNLYSIIKIKVRSDKGQPEHSAEFRINDRASWIKELRFLKDVFGVNHFELKGRAKKMEEEQIIEEIDEEKENLKELEEKQEKESDWREKTRGLREADPELQKRMKNL